MHASPAGSSTPRWTPTLRKTCAAFGNLARIKREVCHTMRSIMPLHDLHLLLPFALPSAADAATALHNLESPALDRLLARATLDERVIGENFQRTLPQECWVARQFGVVNSHAATDEAPLSPYMLLADGG